MYISQVDFGTPSFDELVHLRDLLLRKPIGLEFTPEQISLEYGSIHFAAYSFDHNLLGTLVLLPMDKRKVKMRQVAVFSDAQKKGVGRLLVAKSEIFSKINKFEEIVLSARATVVSFYEKLGYKVISDLYQEVGIDHYRMNKKII